MPKYKVAQGAEDFLYAGVCNKKLVKGVLHTLTQDQLTAIKTESPEYPFIVEDSIAPAVAASTETKSNK